MEADGFLENYEHLKNTNAKRVDFEVTRCKTLPDVEGGSSGGFGSKGGYGGGRSNGGDRDYNGGSRGGAGGGYNSRGGDRGGDRNGGDRSNGGGDGWGNNNSRSNTTGGGNGWGNAPSGSGWNQSGSYNAFPNPSDFKPKQQTELGGSSRYSQNTAESTPQHSQQHEKTSKSNVIYMSNLSFDVNEQAIMEFLADFNPLRAKLLIDAEGKSKGTGFV